MELIFLLAALLPALIGAGGMIASNVATNDANKQAVEETNKANKEIQEQANVTNLQAVRETNASNVQQAELAYQRSLPVNQVRDLMNAGMSKVGALQKLAGGGSYTAPALSAGQVQASNMQAPHFDYSSIGDALDRLNNVPSNVQQMNLVQEQIQSIRDKSRIDRERAKREQDIHDYNMWKERYGKDSALKLDSVSSSIATALADSGKDISSYKSFEDLVHSLGIDKSKEYKQLPHLARVQLEDSVRSKFTELRSQHDQANEDRAAEIRNRIDKQTLDDMRAHATEFKKSANLRDKKRKNDELQEDVRAIALQMDYDLKELERDFKFEKDKNGRTIVTPHEGISQVANEFWHTVGSVIGLNYVGDILKGLIAVGPK